PYFNDSFAPNMSAENILLASARSIRSAPNCNPFPTCVGQAARLSCCHTPDTHARLGDTVSRIPLATRSGLLTPTPHPTAPHRNRAARAAVDTISHIPDCSLRAPDYPEAPAHVLAQHKILAKRPPTAALPDAATPDRQPVQ